MSLSRSLALSLVAYLACVFPRSAQARVLSESQNMDWTKPSTHDVFGPGGTIVAEWTAKKTIVSPSVALCSQASQEDDQSRSDCGGTVWPEVKQDGGVFSFSLEVPDIKSTAAVYLRMKDDFGNVVRSPTFSLNLSGKSEQSSGSSADKGSSASTSEGAGSNDTAANNKNSLATSDDRSSAQTPLDGSGHGSQESRPVKADAVSTSFSSGKPRPSAGRDASAASGSSRANPVPSANVAPASSQVEGTGHPIATGMIPTSPNAKAGNGNPDFVPAQDKALSRASLPTAAVAVPISLVGATLLASLVLCIAHRRSLAAQQARNAQLMGIQRNASVNTTGTKAPSITSATSKTALIDDPDIEKAIDALHGYDNKTTSRQANLQRQDSVMYAPTPARYPVPRQDVRRERSRASERSYEWPSDRSYRSSRAHSDRYMRSPSPSCYSSYSRPSSEDDSRPIRAHHRRNSTIQAHNNDRDRDDDDGGSSTGTILSGYYSPQISSPRLAHYERYETRPQVPRPHSRQTAPELEGYRYRRSDDEYRTASSPRARTHRSW